MDDVSGKRKRRRARCACEVRANPTEGGGLGWFGVAMVAVGGVVGGALLWSAIRHRPDIGEAPAPQVTGETPVAPGETPVDTTSPTNTRSAPADQARRTTGGKIPIQARRAVAAADMHTVDASGAVTMPFYVPAGAPAEARPVGTFGGGSVGSVGVHVGSDEGRHVTPGHGGRTPQRVPHAGAPMLPRPTPPPPRAPVARTLQPAPDPDAPPEAAPAEPGSALPHLGRGRPGGPPLGRVAGNAPRMNRF